MAIQDLINEVNSIQTKKQAIKEAITAKGVTSEGKLSKFADEIKQINTGEPDWYILNRIRHDNGNEGIVIRTNTDEIEAHTASLMTQQSSSFIYDENVWPGIINGSYFPKKEAIYRRTLISRNRYNATITDANNNLSLEYVKSGGNSGWKYAVFSDVNKNDWLKPYKNDVLVNHNALYFKAEDNTNGKLYSTKDITGQNAIGRPIYATLGRKTEELSAISIDSSTFLMASKWTDNVATGFFKCDNILENIYLKPMEIRHETDPDDEHALYLKTDMYNDLPVGNYAIFYYNDRMYLFFVGINYVVNGDGLKKKNIEVYPYTIWKTNPTSELDTRYFTNDKPVEFYLNFSEQGQKAIKDATSIKSFRRRVLVANGTPEANTSKFLNGQDALLVVSAAKNMMDKKPTNINTLNVFKRSNIVFSARNLVVRYSDSGSTVFNGSIISKTLTDDIASNNKIVGFIRLNDDSNTIFPIELEKATDEIINNNTNINTYKNNYQLACISPSGIPNKNNKTVVFVSGSKYGDNIQAFYIKKGTAYITNDWLSTVNKNTYLYLTSDTQIQAYLNSKPLSDIWTEIEDVLAHREEYDAYSGR